MATAVALMRIWPGLAPGSLFLDDQWVAIALRDVGLTERLGLHLPMPVGFAALAGLPAAVLPDRHLALQLLPVVSYLASVALFPVLVHRLTGSTWAAALGTALLVAAPLTPDLAVRVKHYSLDQLVTVGILLLMVDLLRADAPGRRVSKVALLALATVLSFSSIFLSVAAIGTVLATAWLSPAWAAQRRHVTVAAAAFLTVVTAFFVLYVRRASRPIMVEFWSAYFPSSRSLGGIVAFVSERVSTFLRLGVPEGGAVLLLLVPVGLVWLWRSERREYCLALVGFYGAVLLTAFLRAYPLGTGRTDTYALAVTTLLVSLGAASALEAIRSQGARRALYGTAISLAALVSVLGPATYPVTDDRAAVEWMLARLDPAEALVLSPYAVFALELYGEERGRLVSADYYGHGFDIIPERPLTFTNAVGRWDVSGAEAVRTELDRLSRFVAAGPQRLTYLETHGVTPGRADVLGIITAAGYSLVERTDFGGLAEAYRFRR